ncbi:MAG: elongation factor P--(R)-beta-lysine ligase [Gammaproteobacteria bacterium]|nr:elongation factor P--(R)-beta-lysine ligase [Gammaproteobacteria bacterium]
MCWRPTCSIEHLKKRSEMMKAIRQFFESRQYLEVETPYMAHFGVTDPHLANIEAQFRGQTYSLQTSPEYHMKRLLAAGSGPIFQIARVFRDDEFGRWHNPEFTLLEWYQLGVDHFYLIAEIEALFKRLCEVPAFVHMRYQAAFERYCQFNPLDVSQSMVHQICENFGLGDVLGEHESVDQHLHLLMAMVVEPGIAKDYDAPVVMLDFPASQASLAKTDGLTAHRFEIYWRGVELANGFHELTDPSLQAHRFAEDNRIREELNYPIKKVDHLLLSALEHGMPECSGVAIGLDRLFALLLKQDNIAQVLSFAFPNL